MLCFSPKTKTRNALTHVTCAGFAALYQVYKKRLLLAKYSVLTLKGFVYPDQSQLLLDTVYTWIQTAI